MKKLFYVGLVLVLTFASVALADTTSKLPADVQASLQKAISIQENDPPIDVEFLYDIAYDENVRKYIEAYQGSIFIVLGEGHISIDKGLHGRALISVGLSEESGGCADQIVCTNDGPIFNTDFRTDNGMTMPNNCATTLTAYLRSHRQSEFWTAFNKAIQISAK